MIRIDNNYHIETEQNGQCVLVFTETRENKKGEPTEYKDYWYLSNIKSCLLRYFELRQEEAQSIKELYSRIEEVEKIIKNVGV